MEKKIRTVILIRNYVPDKQESMRRFADMLETGLLHNDVSVLNWTPPVFFGKISKSTTNGYGKWLGYLDKWLLFPSFLCLKVLGLGKKDDIAFHVCDHSNSPYLKYLPYKRSSITCHDVLAIRGALGYADAYCPASSFGKILQNWILSNLSKANAIACVSNLTYNQLLELLPPNVSVNKNWTVIHNAFNAEYKPMPASESAILLTQAGIDINIPFLLHVGSALPRKNRRMLVEMIAELQNRWQGNVCFAGQPIDSTLQKHIDEQMVSDRVISVIKPDHKTLTALYSCCTAFVFPSFSEGFGWPLIEAQACGAPVIASNIEPMPEVSGGAALHANPNIPSEFVSALLHLLDDKEKNRLIAKGFKNIQRFSSDAIIKQYIHFFVQNKVNYVS